MKLDPGTATYGLKSDITVSLKTGYEQKFIGDIDPGSAMLDILRNLTRMGTSDVIYLAPNSKLLDSLRTASQAGHNGKLWWTFIENLWGAFTKALNDSFTNIKDKLKGNDKAEKHAKEQADLASSVDEHGVEKTPEQKKADKKTLDNMGKSTKSANNVKTLLDDSLNLIKSLGASILGSTVAKYKWPLKGGLGVMTGENTTPWHLTLGNPKSPFISLGNVVVEKVNVNFKNELGFNDIPTRIDVDVKVKLGRNLGGQEIFAMFNNGYTRVYDTTNKSQMSLAKLYKTDGTVAATDKISTVKNK